MSLIRGIAQKDPSGILSLLTLAAAPVAALFHHPEFAPVFVALAAAILGLRTQVTPTSKAAAVTSQAAATAAIEVARNLTADTAGAAGEVTGAAAGVVDQVLEAVGGLTAPKT